MMKKFFLALFLLFLSLAGCTAPGSPTPAVTLEPSPAPTSSPSALQNLILASGDLPDEYTPSGISAVLPDSLAGIPAPNEIASYTIRQQEALGGGEAGFVVGMRYTDPKNLEMAWEQFNQTLFTFEALDSLGVRASANESEVVFSTCDSIVFIHFEGVYLEEDILPLAKRILLRLEGAPCLF